MTTSGACIFCGNQNAHEQSVEHIIPRSLGNLHYVLPKGYVCTSCNQRFSRFERRVLASPLFMKERHRLGLLRDPSQEIGESLQDPDLARLLLKMGFEGLRLSRRKVWERYDFTPLLDLLVLGQPSEMFLNRNPSEAIVFKSIPRWIDRFRLRRNNLVLSYGEARGELFIRFQFGRIQSTMRIA